MKSVISFPLILFVLIFFSFSLWAQERIKETPSPQRQCKRILTEASPFFISHATSQGTKEWENFRTKARGGSNTVSHFIPKGSVVKQIRKDGNSGPYLAVEVISTNKPNSAILKGRYKENSVASNLPGVESGDKGFLYTGSLEQTSDFVFVVSENTDFFSLPAPFDEARAFKVATEDGKFVTNRCCDADNKCEDFPVFKVMLESNWEDLELVFDHQAQMCQIFNDTRPIRLNQFESIDNLLRHPDLGMGGRLLGGREPNANDLYYVDSRGFVMMPHLMAEGGETDVSAPYGSYHYTGSGGSIGEQFGEDAYVSPWAACGFMAVLREWQRRYPECDESGCGVGWGNCSHAQHIGKTRSSEGHFLWPHASHTHGHCIDIKLISNTKDIKSLTVTSDIYDRERNTELIRLFQQAGATVILLQDKVVAKMVELTREDDMPPVLTHIPPHRDHIHICFSHRPAEESNADPREEATNERLIKACRGDALAAEAGKPFEGMSEENVPRTIAP